MGIRGDRMTTPIIRQNVEPHGSVSPTHQVSHVCLACLSAETRGNLVMCRRCFAENQDVIREVQAEPILPSALRRKIWGQRFAKNRTPKIRARIAMASYLLAQSGDDELLSEIRRTFPKQKAEAASPREEEAAEENQPLASEASAVSNLEAALGKRDREKLQSPGAFRTRDGHHVRSKSEREIANFLFDNRIAYQYERRVTIGGVDMYPDFFLPDVGEGGTYLEHFGLLTEKRYHEWASRKADLFRAAGLRLIATDEDDALDFESCLQRKFAPYIPNLRRH